MVCRGDGMCLELIGLPDIWDMDLCRYYPKRYPRSNIEYNQSFYSSCPYNCSPKKCPNFELCDTTAPDWYLGFWEGYCMSCYMSFGQKTLEFRDVTEPCVICFDTKHRELKFPADCRHWFCISCSINIIFWDVTRYCLSPVPYGCPPCPNGCKNPLRGLQCGCGEFYNNKAEIFCDFDKGAGVIQKWERRYPDQYQKWLEDERISFTIPIGAYANRTCPLCRKSLEDYPQNKTQ